MKFGPRHILLILFMLATGCSQQLWQSPGSNPSVGAAGSGGAPDGAPTESGWSYEGQNGSGRLYFSSNLCADGGPAIAVEFSVHRRKATLLRNACQSFGPDVTTILPDSEIVYDQASVENGLYPETISYLGQTLFLRPLP